MNKSTKRTIELKFWDTKRTVNELPKSGPNSKAENWILGYKSAIDYCIAQLTDCTSFVEFIIDMDILTVEAYERAECYPDYSAMNSFMDGKAKGFVQAKKLFVEVMNGQQVAL